MSSVVTGVARRWDRGDFARAPEVLARRLLGQRLVRTLATGERLAGLIVETEAYLGVRDRAAHSFGGRRTPRNEAMYAEPGTAYVYFTYGMHFCFNVVCGAVDEPVAVLIRALRPTEGLDEMRQRRAAGARGRARRLRDRAPTDVELCSGPARLCQAMGIDRGLNGVDLTRDDALFIEAARTRTVDARLLLNSARIGVEGAGDWAGAPLRWRLRGDPNVSRP